MHYTLFELNNLVRQTIEQTLSEEYWVEAELSEARQVNGHCYMELVEKDDLHNTPWLRHRQNAGAARGAGSCPSS